MIRIRTLSSETETGRPSLCKSFIYQYKLFHANQYIGIIELFAHIYIYDIKNKYNINGWTKFAESF